MSRISPRTLALLAVPAVTLLGVQTTSCDSSNSAEGGGGGGGGGGGNAPPVVTVSPVGGEYSQAQSVALSTNESATIYYYLTSDPNDATVPDPADPTSFTGSGPAPITGISLPGAPAAEVEYWLSYLAVDSGDLASVPDTTQYLIDRNVPTLGISGDPQPIGVLESATVMWSATDDGSYFATLGGDGSPGSGIEVAAGLYPEPPEGQPFPTIAIEVHGIDLELGASDVPLTLFFSDAAGNEASAEWMISQTTLLGAPVPTGTSELAAAPGLGLVYALDAAAAQMLVIDPATGMTTASIGVDPMPNGLALTPNESSLYVSCMASIQRIETATNTVAATIPVAAGAPSGPAATPDGARVYFTVDDGTLAYVDTSNDMLMATSVSGQPWLSSHIAFTPDPANTRAAIAWKNAVDYSIEVYDVMADALTATDPLGNVPVALGVVGRVVTANDIASQLTWAGGPSNSLARFDISGSPSLEQFESTIKPGGLALTPTEATLVVSVEDSLMLQLRDPASLSTSLGVYDLSLAADAGLSSTGVGAALQAVNWGVGDVRLFLVKNPATASAELVGLALD